MSSQSAELYCKVPQRTQGRKWPCQWARRGVGAVRSLGQKRKGELLELDEARVQWTRAGRAQAVEERIQDKEGFWWRLRRRFWVLRGTMSFGNSHNLEELTQGKDKGRRQQKGEGNQQKRQRGVVFNMPFKWN